MIFDVPEQNNGNLTICRELLLYIICHRGGSIVYWSRYVCLIAEKGRVCVSNSWLVCGCRRRQGVCLLRVVCLSGCRWRRGGCPRNWLLSECRRRQGEQLPELSTVSQMITRGGNVINFFSFVCVWLQDMAWWWSLTSTYVIEGRFSVFVYPCWLLSDCRGTVVGSLGWLLCDCRGHGGWLSQLTVVWLHRAQWLVLSADCCVIAGDRLFVPLSGMLCDCRGRVFVYLNWMLYNCRGRVVGSLSWQFCDYMGQIVCLSQLNIV